ncbi:MAG TPA: GAF domain-containing protein, partial [Herpetosiphonaceae bacterium]
MTRWAVLLLSSTFVTMIFALLGVVSGLPLFAVPLIGLSIAGVMWWRWPWAIGSALGAGGFAALVFEFSPPLSMVLGGIVALEGALPAWMFRRRQQLYDLSHPSALVLFLIHGVVLNTFAGSLLATAALAAGGVIPRGDWLYVFALLWLIQALTALKLTLPILRFGTCRLRLDGLFATPAAAQRGIGRPQFSRDDLVMLIEILSVLAMCGWLINLRTLISPQIISTLFLLPMIWFAARRGFDGALLAGLTGTLTALAIMLGPPGRAELIVRAASEQRSFATIVFELVVFYLASMVIGLLIDAQRAERRRLETLLDLNRMVAETTDQSLLLQRLADAVHDAVSASTCIIAHYDAATHALEPLATATAVPLSPLLRAPLIATNYPALTRVLTTGESQTVHINDPQLAPSSSAFFAETGYITAMLVPLQRNNRIFGLVEVFDVRPERQFAPDEVRLVEAMGSRGAGAMEQARLIKALRDHTEQLGAVSDITSILNATLDLDVVCRDIARQIGRVVPHDLAAVALADPGEDSLRVVMSTQPEILAKDEPLPLAAEPAWADDEPLRRLDLAALDLPWAER